MNFCQLHVAKISFFLHIGKRFVHLVCACAHLPEVSELAFQLFWGEAQAELSVACHGYAAGFFGNDDGEAVAFLRDTECGAVAQA